LILHFPPQEGSQRKCSGKAADSHDINDDDIPEMIYFFVDLPLRQRRRLRSDRVFQKASRPLAINL
jgi:hypothetical protein